MVVVPPIIGQKHEMGFFYIFPMLISGMIDLKFLGLGHLTNTICRDIIFALCM